MTRSDHDSWDITESVGATALHIAAARAAETRSPDRLIDDPYAQLFLQAAGEDIAKTLWSAPHPNDQSQPSPGQSAIDRARLAYTASRTKFFDDLCVRAAGVDVRQIVILAAGLDARAWRLPWPDGTVVYEIDQPKVLQFKAAVLQAHQCHTAARYVAVPIDLRNDWPKALRQAGFDPSRPTAWLAEGLLPYLPAQAQDLLFDRVHAFSANGSQVGVEAFDKEFFNPTNVERHRTLRRRAAAAQGNQSQRRPDTADLWYLEERTNVAEWLGLHGWSANVTSAKALVAQYDRLPPAGSQDAIPTINLVEGRLTKPQRPFE